MAEWRQLVHRNRRSIVGIALALVVGFAYASMNSAVKSLHTLPIEQLLLVRLGALTIVYAPWFAFRRASDPTGIVAFSANHKWLAALSLLTPTVNVLLFLSLTLIDVGDTTSLFSSVSVWTALLGALLLGERVTRGVGASILLVLVGTALVARPALIFHPTATTSAIDRVMGIAAALGGALAAGLLSVTIRRLRHVERSYVILWQSVPASVVLLVLVMVRADYAELLELIGTRAAWSVAMAIAVVALGGVTAQFALVSAMRFAKAEVVMLGVCSQTVFAYVMVRRIEQKTSRE